jgi:excisionase family DNA binding protein
MNHYHQILGAPASAVTPEPIQVGPREAARLLGLGERKLWELTKSGDIPHIKVGRLVRYRIASLKRWSREQEVRTGQEEATS